MRFDNVSICNFTRCEMVVEPSNWVDFVCFKVCAVSVSFDSVSSFVSSCVPFFSLDPAGLPCRRSW